MSKNSELCEGVYQHLKSTDSPVPEVGWHSLGTVLHAPNIRGLWAHLDFIADAARQLQRGDARLALISRLKRASYGIRIREGAYLQELDTAHMIKWLVMVYDLEKQGIPATKNAIAQRVDRSMQTVRAHLQELCTRYTFLRREADAYVLNLPASERLWVWSDSRPLVGKVVTVESEWERMFATPIDRLAVTQRIDSLSVRIDRLQVEADRLKLEREQLRESLI